MMFADRSSYLTSHYSLKHRIVAAISRLFDGYVYTVRHGLVEGLRRKGGLGFLPTSLVGGGETAETRFFQSLHLNDEVVFDIGGFQGILTMFFASRARSVVVYEPNPVSRARLEENIALNKLNNVIVRPVGVGAHAGSFELVFDSRMAGGASANASISTQIRSTSSRVKSARIQIVSLDEDIATQRLPLPSFVKIDIEGMELDALRGMSGLLKSTHPHLYIEMHGATMSEKLANARLVVDAVFGAGYSRVTHIESGEPVHPERCEVAAEGHLFCE